MSYKVAFAPDAVADWQLLPLSVQEAVLDELERVAASASFPPSIVEFTCEITHHDAGAERHLSLYLSVSHATNTISLLGVGGFTESDPLG